jgi:hypothetical protein
VDGQPKDTNLDAYTPLRMGDVPDVEVEFLPSTEMPVGRPPRWSVGRQRDLRGLWRAPAPPCRSARKRRCRRSTRAPYCHCEERNDNQSITAWPPPPAACRGRRMSGSSSRMGSASIPISQKSLL